MTDGGAFTISCPPRELFRKPSRPSTGPLPDLRPVTGANEDRAAGSVGSVARRPRRPALGVGAGLAWLEIFKTSNFEGYSGMMVFFIFMPLGAILGGLAG